MYSEWMDAVPILINRCFEHNRGQLQRARDFWEREGNQEMVESYDAAIRRENEEEAHWISLSWWEKRKIEAQERKEERRRRKEYYAIYGRKYW